MAATQTATVEVIDAIPDRLTRYPVTHFRGCAVDGDAMQALEWVEHYRDRYRTGRARDVDNQQLGAFVMVAHCCKCGGMSYHNEG